MRCGWGGRGVSMLLGRCRVRVLEGTRGRVMLGEVGLKGLARTCHFRRRMGIGLRWQEIDTVATYSTVKQMLLGCVVIYME